MANALFVFLGGGLGSLLRFGVSALSGRLVGEDMPWGTLAVNLLGSFLIGLLAGFAQRDLLARPIRFFLVTGVLGGFTTFSAFSYETVRLMQSSPAKGMANAALNLGGGLALAAAGFFLSSRA